VSLVAGLKEDLGRKFSGSCRVLVQLSWGRTAGRCSVVSNLLLLDHYNMSGDEAEEVAAPEAPADAPAEGEAPPPPPKKKPKFFVHWNRKKSRFYDYIFDYGENYYSGMVRYIDTRAEVPRRMAFAERGMRSSLVRKSLADTRTENLLNDVNKSIKNFELSQKNYIWEHTKKV
ncbi:unnamed protein product, partial [Meganyctiphanes norvegica]